jgi:hypothetical protein
MAEYKDLRSASLDSKRDRSRRAKYNNFSTTTPGQLNEPHWYHPYRLLNMDYYTPVYNSSCSALACSEGSIVPRLTKRQFFQLSQNGRNRHRASPDRQMGWYIKETEVRRGTKAAKKACREWQSEWHDERLEALDESIRWHLGDHLSIDEVEAAETYAGVVHSVDVSAMLDKAESEWLAERKRELARLGWVDAWDDENWWSEDEDVWADVREDLGPV